MKVTFIVNEVLYFKESIIYIKVLFILKKDLLFTICNSYQNETIILNGNLYQDFIRFLVFPRVLKWRRRPEVA